MLSRMTNTDCPRCGSPMVAGGVCPVCEIPHHADDGRAPAALEPAAPTALGRFFQSGRLAVLVAAAGFLGATVAPLVSVKHTGEPGARAWLTPAAMILSEGRYGRELRGATLIVLPGAALGLLSFLLSRRTRSAMLATRPLLLVVSALPLMAAVLAALRLGKHDRYDWAFGPGMALVALGACAGLLGALQFGRGTRDPAPRRARDDEDDGD
jgi:hypothetical protein